MTRFPKIRRWLFASVIVGPCLVFASFLFGARGHGLEAICVALLGLFVLFLVPAARADQGTPRPDNIIVVWVKRLAAAAVIYWLVTQPEATRLMDRITKEHALWDWRIIGAVGIWVLCWMYTGIRHVNATTDKAIYRELNQ